MVPQRYPRVTDLLLQLPPWFRALGTPQGIDAFEQRRGTVIPEPLKRYFASPAASCWLQAHAETDTFLSDETFPDPPPLVCWSGQQHLVIGHFAHSDTVVAVELNCDDPHVAWGYAGDSHAFHYPPLRFTHWLSRIAPEILGAADANHRV